ncbi:hypothetical protein BDR05DRAFT_1054875 [Suillus weaverae]|nr:hypothetical protein BDR05DRAFT_1054875 [Suillus weaverae]
MVDADDVQIQTELAVERTLDVRQLIALILGVLEKIVPDVPLLDRDLTQLPKPPRAATQTNAKPSSRSSFHVIFPDPPPLLPELLSMGLIDALKINCVYISRAADLLQNSRATIDRLFIEFAEIPSPHVSVSIQQDMIACTVVSVYVRTLQAWVHKAKAMSQDHLLRFQESKASTCDRFSRISTSDISLKGDVKFNHSYVLLSKQIFDENHSRKHVDAFLAQKSDMIYRQIHSWFYDRTGTLPLDTVHHHMENFTKLEEQRVDISLLSPSPSTPDLEAHASSIRDAACNPLESLAPSLAFPLSYSLSSSYYPFPSRNGVTDFGAPKWLRSPSSTVIARPYLDIDRLIAQFSRMNVLDDSSSSSGFCGNDSFAAVATIIPPPSPQHHCSIFLQIWPICSAMPWKAFPCRPRDFSLISIQALSGTGTFEVTSV